MDRNRISLSRLGVIGAVLLVASLPAYALRVGWNVDIQQNKFQNGANDYHIWGILESGDPTGASPPQFVGQVNFLTAPPAWLQGAQAFQNFTTPPRIDNGQVPPGRALNWPIIPPPPAPVPPAMPLLPPPPGPPYMPPFYYFDATWSSPIGQGYIPFGNWVHLGLEFDETCHNVGYWLQGVWTRDGVDPGTNPILGFRVEDQAPGEFIRIQNASGNEVEVRGMDLMVLSPVEGMAFELENLNKSFFDTHPEWNARWVSVPTSLLPDGPWVDSFFDVFFDQVPGFPGMGDTGQVLLAQQRLFDGTSEFWQYELHEEHKPEPLTMIAVAAGLGGLAGYARRRRMA